MAMEAVLLYNCDGPAWMHLHQVLAILRMPMCPVTPEQYGLPLEDLASGAAKSAPPAPVEEEFHQPMLVFCFLSEDRLDQVLTLMRRVSLPPIPLKAILTPSNRTWTSQQLWRELRREHERMSRKP